jgi:hypothetical protein
VCATVRGDWAIAADRLIALGWGRLDEERARIRNEIKTLPTLELPTGIYVDIEDVYDAIEGTDA